MVTNQTCLGGMHTLQLCGFEFCDKCSAGSIGGTDLTLERLTLVARDAVFGTLDRSWKDIDAFPTLWGPFWMTLEISH